MATPLSATDTTKIKVGDVANPPLATTTTQSQGIAANSGSTISSASASSVNASNLEHKENITQDDETSIGSSTPNASIEDSEQKSNRHLNKTQESTNKAQEPPVDIILNAPVHKDHVPSAKKIEVKKVEQEEPEKTPKAPEKKVQGWLSWLGSFPKYLFNKLTSGLASLWNGFLGLFRPTSNTSNP